MAKDKYIPIRAWHSEDRPREKMQKLGRGALTNSELLAIILGSGSKEKSAVDLAKEILDDCDNNLQRLGKISIDELMNYKGVGLAKAISIAAVLELGRRRQAADVVEKPKITCSRDAYTLLKPQLEDLPHEEFWVLLLNRSNRVLKTERISIGGVSSSMADTRIVFKSAITMLASAVILAHNHPSGALVPSQSDIDLTRKLKQAGKYLNIDVLDHLIIGDKAYYSFCDEGKL